jgi:hypothetical protein
MDDHPVAGFRITSADRPSRRSRPGRRCTEEGCEVVLSIYNDGDRCSLHAPMVTVRTRGTKPAA